MSSRQGPSSRARSRSTQASTSQPYVNATEWQRKVCPCMPITRSLDPPNNWPQVQANSSISGGRSGSFFLKTYDNTLLLKTISHKEQKSLISRLVPELAAHPQRSLLARIHGVFSVKTSGTVPEYVILMDNILQIPTDIAETYDLKGSRLNREVGETAPFMPSRTLKDVDFMKRAKQLHLSRLDKDRFAEAVIADISLLSCLHLTDYSMLVAIGEYPGDLADLPPYLSRHLFRLEGSRTQVYCIGLIDYLETYSFKKRVETASKRLVAAEKDISSMSSQKYAERFLDMVRSILDY